MENNVVAIWLWGSEVGRIYWDDSLHRSVFAYSDDFRRGGVDISPLSASIRSVAAQQPIVGSREKLYQGLPPFLADSLPDKWGNLVFENWRKMHQIRSKQINAVDKLSFIGSRGMGALEFQPAVPLEQMPDVLPLTELYRLAQRIFEERSEVRIMPDESLTMQSLYAVGTSAGGKHPKALIAINKQTGEVCSGQVDLGSDYEYFIIKFAEKGDFPITQVEYAYYLMAQDMGVEMMPSRLIEVDGAQHFLTQRFDRRDGKRIHVQTLAAMMETADSYEDLLMVARRLGLSQDEQDQLFLRMVLNVLGGNVDDHTKNFSFLLAEGGEWHIAPAYDVTFTIDVDGAFYENRHELSLLGKTEKITRADLLQFARENSIKHASSLVDQVTEVLTKWVDYAQRATVPQQWAERIGKQLEKLIDSHD